MRCPQKNAESNVAKVEWKRTLFGRLKAKDSISMGSGLVKVRNEPMDCRASNRVAQCEVETGILALILRRIIKANMIPKEKTFYCACVAGKKCQRLVVTKFKDGEPMFDIWEKKKCVGGIVLQKQDVKKLIKFISTKNICKN